MFKVCILVIINIIDLYHAILKQEILPVLPLIQCEAGRAENKAFCSLGTQNGRRVMKGYSTLKVHNFKLSSDENWGNIRSFFAQDYYCCW